MDLDEWMDKRYSGNSFGANKKTEDSVDEGEITEEVTDVPVWEEDAPSLDDSVEAIRKEWFKEKNRHHMFPYKPVFRTDSGGEIHKSLPVVEGELRKSRKTVRLGTPLLILIGVVVSALIVKFMA